ncbi:hypothetical protein Tco_1021232, partial [Tanacetum coccineum]
KRISDKRTKNEAKNDKTERGMEERGKAKVKKSKSTPQNITHYHTPTSQRDKDTLAILYTLIRHGKKTKGSRVVIIEIGHQEKSKAEIELLLLLT